ncbi:low affinity iron permease family protein [Nonomuraea dietziae]|uniref:low affinity iron permease family protein n=1 Tax=Nonomuraea dietziae TaxID=65515 RepID=UPI003CD054C5
MCVLLVLVWAPSFFLIGDLDHWQLIINTLTTIVTFLLVALLPKPPRPGPTKRCSTSSMPSPRVWPS